MTSLAPALESFFAVRLIQQRQASPQTIGAYGTTFRLLLDFAQHRLGKPPSALELNDLDAQLITAFLAHLEHDRHNSVRTRNARLAAIRSMFRYAALGHPECSALIQQVFAIPDKRSERTIVTFLTDIEVAALLDPLTAGPGPDGGITRCWRSPSRQDCGSPSSPGSPAPTSSWAEGPTCDASARVESRSAHRSQRQLSLLCVHG
jgi:site-specific recombinase XerD